MCYISVIYLKNCVLNGKTLIKYKTSLTLYDTYVLYMFYKKIIRNRDITVAKWNRKISKINKIFLCDNFEIYRWIQICQIH